MTTEKIKRMLDACYQAKRIRELLPALPNGVAPSYIHYLDVILALEKKEVQVKLSDISDKLNLPRPGVTRTVKEMEEKRYEEMSNVELMGVIAEKDSVIDGLVDKLKRNETSLLGKNEIMEVYHCQSNKALQILKHMMMCKFAVKVGKEYYCTPENHAKFISQMSGKEVFI